MRARSIAMCNAVADGPFVVENDTAIVRSDQPGPPQMSTTGSPR